TYTDYTPIQVSLSVPLRFPVTTSSIDVLAYWKATDCIDGDISYKFTLSGSSSIEVDLAGDYPVVFQITNSVGDTLELPVTVTIYDQTAENASPKFSLTDYLVYVKEGEEISPISYIESVTVQGTTYEVTSTGSGTYGIDTSDMDSEELQEFRERDPELSSDYIEIDNPVDYSTPGVYEITYSMEDEDGDVGSIRLIVIMEEG
ncbi:MAG: hypothetical protein LUH07_06545, partial [Lachnospiraceae bacterium]|nr:hypothetical protein [Lachnospiraceae bacterium]